MSGDRERYNRKFLKILKFNFGDSVRKNLIFKISNSFHLGPEKQFLAVLVSQATGISKSQQKSKKNSNFIPKLVLYVVLADVNVSLHFAGISCFLLVDQQCTSTVPALKWLVSDTTIAQKVNNHFASNASSVINT